MVRTKYVYQDTFTDESEANAKATELKGFVRKRYVAGKDRWFVFTEERIDNGSNETND